MFNFVKWYNGLAKNEAKKDLELAKKAFKELVIVRPMKEFILLRDTVCVYTYAKIRSDVTTSDATEIVYYVTDSHNKAAWDEVSSTVIATVHVPAERDGHRVWLELDEKFQHLYGLRFPLVEEQRSVYSVMERNIVEL